VGTRNVNGKAPEAGATSPALEERLAQILRDHLGHDPATTGWVELTDVDEEEEVESSRRLDLLPPVLVALNRDDQSAEYVGKTKDGRQFFMTTPFIPATSNFVADGQGGREFLALYTFDRDGQLLAAVIDDLGPRGTRGEEAVRARQAELLRSLGQVAFGRIAVAPFAVNRFGVEFGFIPQPPEDDEDVWCVTVEPGNYMCFYAPWTSGDYDS